MLYKDAHMYFFLIFFFKSISQWYSSELPPFAAVTEVNWKTKRDNVPAGLESPDP